MHNFVGFEHTAFLAAVIGGSAVDVPIPQPASIGTLGPSIDSVDDLLADELELRCPITNAADVYVDLEGTAIVGANDLVVRPGEAVTVSGASKTTLSAVSTAASQTLDIIAKYR